MPGAESFNGLLVVKVGGSLFDLPDLGPRLGSWLDELTGSQLLLVPGGGAAANAVRDLDRQHGLGEELAHWLALRAVSLNAYFLSALMWDRNPIVTEEQGRFVITGGLAILDGYGFARADEARPHPLPHSWKVTTDSLAARVAVLIRARHLILLKSMSIPDGLDCHEAAQRGFVDGFFPQAVAESGPELEVRTINFRTWRPGQLASTCLRVAGRA